jgi:hypothetical protein
VAQVNTTENNQKIRLSDFEFARLGGGQVAYIREINHERAAVLLGEAAVPSGMKLFCLYAADGTPMAISGSHEAAVANAFQHELEPVTVH